MWRRAAQFASERDVDRPNFLRCGDAATPKLARHAHLIPHIAVGANATCVHISATFSQCVPVEKSRGYGCSATYAQCGGTDAGVSTMWSGPYCCGAEQATECVLMSDTYSQARGRITAPKIAESPHPSLRLPDNPVQAVQRVLRAGPPRSSLACLIS